MRDIEVLVVGLGAMGSAALYHLARQGAAPVGIEQYPVGHAFGSSHGHSRVFRILYRDRLYVNMVKAALPLWQELEAQAGETLLTLNGFVSFAQVGNEAFGQEIQVMEETQTPYQLLSPQEVTARFPVLQPPAGTVACYMAGAGFLNAGRAVQTHVAQAQRFGATVYEQVQVHRLDLNRDQPVLETTAGRFRCQRLIITPGPWAADILAELALPLQVTRQQKFYFRPRHSLPYQPAHLPIYADYEQRFYGFPYYGPGLKVADDALGAVTSPQAIDRSLDYEKRAQLKTWLEMIMPGLDLTFVEGATCMYTLTPDRDFLIGPHPKRPNVFIGGGFSGHGFKFSTLIGKILAELALKGTTDQPIERFRLDRFA